MKETKVGVIVHFFQKPKVAVVRMETGFLAVGDTIHITGRTTDLYQKVDSMQIDHNDVRTAAPGDLAGVMVAGKTREHDQVLKVEEFTDG